MSEYPGYTDDTLLDLTLDRIRQMVEVIAQRKAREQKASMQQSLLVAQVQVQALGQIMAGLAQTKKSAKGMVKASQSVNFSLDKKTQKELPSTAQVESMMGIGPGGHIGVR